jgi:hypothetical protein
MILLKAVPSSSPQLEALGLVLALVLAVLILGGLALLDSP